MLAIGLLGIAALAGLAMLDRTLLRQDLPWLFVGSIALAREVADPLPAIMVGDIAVNGEDIIVGIALLVVVGWLLRGVALQSPQILMAGAVVLVFFSILRGAPFFGLPAAVNEARETLYFLGAALLGSFAPVDADARRRLMTGWLVLCWSLVALTLLRWAMVVTGIGVGQHWYETEFAGLRVLDANGALVIAIGFLMLLPRVLRGRATELERLAAGAYVVTVALLQHRSVWAVALLGLGFMVWEYRRELDRRLVTTLGISLVLLVAATFTLLDTGELLSQAGRADAASDKTWEWRVSGWADLLEESGPAGPMEYLFGAPYGSGWERSVSAGFDVDVPPHNFYLEMLLRIGIVGVALVVTAGVQSARRLRHHELARDDGYLNAATMLTILTIHAVYSVPYNLGMEQGLLFGLAIAIWADPLRRRGRGMVVVQPPRSATRRAQTRAP